MSLKIFSFYSLMFPGLFKILKYFFKDSRFSKPLIIFQACQKFQNSQRSSKIKIINKITNKIIKIAKDSQIIQNFQKNFPNHVTKTFFGKIAEKVRRIIDRLPADPYSECQVCHNTLSKGTQSKVTPTCNSR